MSENVSISKQLDWKTAKMIAAGVDIGAVDSKVVILLDGQAYVSSQVKTLTPKESALSAVNAALAETDLTLEKIHFTVATGCGRKQVPFAHETVSEIVCDAAGAVHIWGPSVRTVLDIGGQTMKALRLDQQARVQSFRLNDKCAAGTGAFLEKTARYMGYSTEEISALVQTSKGPVTISGVCAVFAESEVINHLSLGSAPADIMRGAMVSLVDRSAQLMRRVRMEPEITLAGGILRFSSMAEIIEQELDMPVNLPPGSLVQFVGAIGAAVLGQRRLLKMPSATRSRQAVLVG